MLGVDRGGDLVAGVLLAAGDDDPGALLGQRLGDGPADAARRAGDDRDLAGEVEQAGSCRVRRRMLGEFDPGDRAVVDLVGAVGEAQGADAGPARGQRRSPG